jgi:hypothetical protein
MANNLDGNFDGAFNDDIYDNGLSGSDGGNGNDFPEEFLQADIDNGVGLGALVEVDLDSHVVAAPEQNQSAVSPLYWLGVSWCNSCFSTSRALGLHPSVLRSKAASMHHQPSVGDRRPPTMADASKLPLEPTQHPLRHQRWLTPTLLMRIRCEMSEPRTSRSR